MKTPTQPPQGVMAPAEALAAIDEAIDHLIDREICDTESVELALTFFKRTAAEVEALREKNRVLTERIELHHDRATEAEARASALLARCEGLEAALAEWIRLARATSLLDPSEQFGFHSAVDALDAHMKAAATRTTGD